MSVPLSNYIAGASYKTVVTLNYIVISNSNFGVLIYSHDLELVQQYGMAQALNSTINLAAYNDDYNSL